MQHSRAFIAAALSFLFDKGYITPEEYAKGKSDRLNNIETHCMKYNGALVVFNFDDNEWAINAEVDKNLNVNRVELYSEETFQILYTN